MASNFPDTSVNNPETGVPWVDGDTWFDSSSDYTYIWYSPVWRTGEASGSDFVKVAGDNMIGDLTLGTDKITLDATAGTIAATDTVAVASSFNADTFSNINANGLICQNPVSNSNNLFFRGRTSSGDNKVDIYTDGSATFSGRVETEEAFVGRHADGNTIVSSKPAGGTGDHFTGILDGVDVFNVAANGSADFSGQVDAGQFRVKTGGSYTSFSDETGTKFALRSNSGSITYASIDNDGSAIFKGTVQTAGGVVTPSMVLQLEADDDTKYTSTTDIEGEVTLVYNGPTLDVKDRLQNVLARMDAIEANEITDDATDSALLTLIASLTARLDERDTAIAALTARVSTLES